MEQQADRRRDVRAYVSPPAQIVRLGAKERIEILNASYRGLFIRTPEGAPALNQLLRVRIELPTKTVDINCIPVRVVVDGNGRAGVGVRFFALNGEDKRFWESYITSLISPRRMAA
ncbi:MAG TPA: PilZ domain-containing protein [Labilithrix sp.]|nr:PilZ domain-containing protein [Labilithrix sp.]